MSPFQGVKFVWQMFQGLAIYAATAALSYAVAAQECAALITNQPSVALDLASPPAQRILLRQGDELHAVEVADIILISAADD